MAINRTRSFPGGLRSLIQALQHEGLGTKAVDQRKIEGLAVREHQVRRVVSSRIGIGLRQPDDLVRAFVADIHPPAPAARTSVDSPLRLRCRRPRRRSLPAHRQWNIFLAGKASWSSPPPRMSRTHSTATRSGLFRRAHSREQCSPLQADKAWVFEVAMKAEGFAFCPSPPGPTNPVPSSVDLDNDPHSTHIPSRYQLVNLSRRSASH